MLVHHLQRDGDVAFRWNNQRFDAQPGLGYASDALVHHSLTEDAGIFLMPQVFGIEPF